MFKLNWLEKAALAFSVCIIGYILISWYNGRQVDLKVTNVVQGAVIKQQAKVIEVAELLADVKEDINLQVRQEEIKVEKKHRVIKDRLEAREVQINTELFERPLEVPAIVAHYEKLSEARIDSLWEAYCSETVDPIACVITVKENEGV